MQNDMKLLIVVIVALAAIWLVCGHAAALQYTDSTGTVHVSQAEDLFLKQSGDTPEIAAERLRSMSANNEDYIAAVYRYAVTNVRQAEGGWTVKSPQRALDEGTGDCSERALLIVEMLTHEGIDARVIYGTIPGVGLHDTVEIHEGKYPSIIDAELAPTFHKIGDGMHPDEKIV